MSTVTIRLSEEEKNFLKDYADMNNKSLSEIVRESIFETIEDKYDLILLKKAIEEFKEDNTTYTSNEVWEMLGI